jgi:hypothetical protein
MNLTSFATAAILAMTSRAAPRAPVPQDRAERIADDIALAVELGPATFSGPAAQEGAALALLVIAEHEGSRFDPRVENCEIVADDGRTVSLFGLMRGASWRGHQRAELCAGGPLPAYLALLAFDGYAQRCRPVPLGWFRGYASGSCSVKSDAASDMCSRWELLARRHGIEGASCSWAQPLRFASGRAPHAAGA